MAFHKLKVLYLSGSHLLNLFYFTVAGESVEQIEEGRQVSLPQVNNLNAFVS